MTRSANLNQDEAPSANLKVTEDEIADAKKTIF